METHFIYVGNFTSCEVDEASRIFLGDTREVVLSLMADYAKAVMDTDQSYSDLFGENNEDLDNMDAMELIREFCSLEERNWEVEYLPVHSAPTPPQHQAQPVSCGCCARKKYTAEENSIAADQISKELKNKSDIKTATELLNNINNRFLRTCL